MTTILFKMSKMSRKIIFGLLKMKISAVTNFFLRLASAFDKFGTQILSLLFPFQHKKAPNPRNKMDRTEVERNSRLMTVAFIAGKKNPAIQKIFIRFSIGIKLKK